MAPNIVPTTFTAKDELSKKVALMQSKVSNFASTTAEKFNKAGQTAFAFGRTTAVASALIIAPLGLAAKSAVDFEEKMSNVSTLIDTTKESISGIGDEVLALSRKLPVPIEELTTSLYDIRSAGISAEDQMMTLEFSAKLAAAGLSTTQESTNILTSAMNAFKKEGKTAAEISDILFKTVKAGKTTMSDLAQAFGANAGVIESAGVQLADFQAATAALTTVGTPAAQAQNQIRASIIALQKPSSAMTKIFKNLGVSSEKELIQREGSLVGAFDAINKAGTSMGVNLSEAWRSSEANAAVTSLLGATNEAYTTTLEDMTTGANALDDAFNKQGKTSKAQLQVMKNNLQSLSITVGNALLPVINDLVQGLAPMIESFGKWMQNNKPLVGMIVKITAGLGAFMAAVSGVSFIVGGFQKALVLGKAAMAAFNMVMSLNPAVAIAAGIAAVGVAVYALSNSFSGLTREQELNNEVNARALDKSLDQRVALMGHFSALREAKEGTEEYTTALSEIERMQPGITEKYNLQTKSVNNLALAEAELTANIMKRAREEARAEIAKEKIKEAIRKSEGGSETDTFAQSLLRFSGRGELVDKTKQAEAYTLTQDAKLLYEQNKESRDSESSPANPDAAKKDQKIELIINGESMGWMNQLDGKSIMPSLGMMPATQQTR